MRTIVVLLSILLVAGCAASKKAEVRPSAVESVLGPASKPPPDRKIVLTAKVKIEVASPDSVYGTMVALAEENGGYVLASRGYVITIRIPAVSFYDALSEIGGWGEVVDRTIDGQDVTEEYYDLEIRLKNAEATHQRYLNLLERASSVDEMLKLERELERLSGQIDLLRGKLDRLAHRVDFCTITVEAIPSRSKPGPVAAVFKGMYSGVRWLFVQD